MTTNEDPRLRDDPLDPDIGEGENIPFPVADAEISSTLAGVPTVQARPPLRPRSLIAATPPSRVWLVSFTDIMGLMLTFFVLTYAMSELEMDKFKQLTSMLSQASGAFSGAPLKMGDADTIPLPRVRYRQGLDAAYLEQILTRKKAEIPALASMTIKREGRNLLLSFPLSNLVTGGNVAIAPDSRPILYELAGVLQATPNQMEILVDPADESDVAKLRALGQGQVILAGLRRFGETLALPVVVNPQMKSKGKDAPVEVTFRITRFLAPSRRG